jgi:butyryl-CoA dehydrogenase
MARATLAAKAKLVSGKGDPQFLSSKIATARFYAEQIMPQVNALLPIIVGGSECVMLLEQEQL